jgi:hypothetical protein
VPPIRGLQPAEPLSLEESHPVPGSNWREDTRREPGITDRISTCATPFTWREFIQARIDDNFADLGQDDTQAAHFRI